MSMSVINSSEAIHDYRRKISNAIEELKNQLKKTEQAIETVSEDWQDHQFKTFQNNFGEDKDQILPLCEHLHVYADDLLYNLEIKLKDYEDFNPRL